jgi:cytochrome P450
MELAVQTSSLLTFVIYLLSLHPDVCGRLREEVLETFGPTGTPTYTDLKKMDYCAFFCPHLVSAYSILRLLTFLPTVRSVLNETLRIFPSAPLVGRTSRDDPLVIPGTSKLYLPPRTQIMMSSLLAHKRPEVWGQDAEVFRPERWLDPALLNKIAMTPFMYSPFYGGPRIVRFPRFFFPFFYSIRPLKILAGSVWDRTLR